MRKSREFTFDERSREILTAAIKTFVATGEPVGSRTLARLSPEGLSAATIRNIMADLEESGYFYQPHTSAGRVPTDKAYRVYVDGLIGQHRLTRQEQERLERGMLDDDAAVRPESLMERTSQLLSRVSDNVGIVIAQSPSQEPLDEIRFVRLAGGRVLVITVSETGAVQDRVLRIDDELTQEDLDRNARFLMENFRGLSMSEIRERLLVHMSEEKALYDRLLQTTILVCERSLAGGEEAGDIYVDGATKIIDKPDFADTDRMRALFRMFEEKSRLVRLLNACLSDPSGSNVRIQIGAESRAPWFRDCSIVASPLRMGDRVVGGIGVVGPTRMEYARVISLVDYVAKLFERALVDNRSAAPR
jgi:heat-inducible transcriptional repressor